MVASKRRFNPNLQKVRIEVKGAPRREYVCTRCLKAGKVAKYVRAGAARRRARSRRLVQSLQGPSF